MSFHSTSRMRVALRPPLVHRTGATGSLGELHLFGDPEGRLRVGHGGGIMIATRTGTACSESGRGVVLGLAVVSLIVLAILGAITGLVLSRVFGAAGGRNRERPGGGGPRVAAAAPGGAAGERAGGRGAGAPGSNRAKRRCAKRPRRSGAPARSSGWRRPGPRGPTAGGGGASAA